MTTLTQEHARFAPSAMGMLMACAGSLKLREAYPEPSDSPSAMEGTAAHEVAAAALTGKWLEVGSLTSNGVAVTDEMLDGAEMYRDALEPYLDGAWIESTVQCSAIHPQCFGTPDFQQVAPKRIVIADYKFGHRHVEVFENWQLVTYAASSASASDDTEVIFIIIQPRSYHRDGPVREWRTTIGALRKMWIRTIHQCEVSLTDEATCTPSPACCDCSGRHACKAAQAASLSALDLATDTVPLELTVDALSLELRMMQRISKILAARIDGLQEQAFSLIRNGTSVPGFALAAGAGREKWSRPVEEVIALGMAMGIDIAKPGAVTPKQAVKLGLPQEVVKAYAETPVGEVKLVASDERQLRKVFSA